MKITLPNGINIDSDGGWAKGLTEYAAIKGFSNIKGFMATHPDKTQEYILVEYEDGKEGQVIYAHTKYEDVCCHIDILWIIKNYE